MLVPIKNLRLVRFDGRDDPGQCDLPGAKVGDEVAQVLMVEFPLYPGNLPPSTCTFGGGQMMYDVFLDEPPPTFERIISVDGQIQQLIDTTDKGQGRSWGYYSFLAVLFTQAKN
jgi:hypothetical protein